MLELPLVLIMTSSQIFKLVVSSKGHSGVVSHSYHLALTNDDTYIIIMIVIVIDTDQWSFHGTIDNRIYSATHPLRLRVF